jgi:hypothetical protein
MITEDKTFAVEIEEKAAILLMLTFAYRSACKDKTFGVKIEEKAAILLILTFA